MSLAIAQVTFYARSVNDNFNIQAALKYIWELKTWNISLLNNKISTFVQLYHVWLLLFHTFSAAFTKHRNRAMSTYSQIDVNDNCTGSINNVGNTFVNCSTPVFNWSTLQPNGNGKTKPEKSKWNNLAKNILKSKWFWCPRNWFPNGRKLFWAPRQTWYLPATRRL